MASLLDQSTKLKHQLMDVLIGIGTSIAGKIGEYTVQLAGSQLGYCFYYKTNIEKLKNEVQHLKNAKQRIQHQVDEATRNLEEIEADVQDWLCGVSATIEEVETFIAEHEERLANTRCYNRLCPNLLSRYKLSKKANRNVQKIVELRAAGRFDTVSYHLTRQGEFEDKGYKFFETRKKTLTSIMDALRDQNIRVIGIHGMAGVGKTMLAKDVARQARKLFHVVIMVTVSQNPNWENIQQEIAEYLGLKELEEKTSIVARADLLQHRLRKEKEVLLILDDVWQKADLQSVGISFGDDQWKCKMMLISRFQEVLHNDMGIENNFSIEVLSDDEAMNLFNEIVGDLRGKFDFQTLATQIVKECAGLPLAIATVASALRNKGLYDWRNALTELKRSTFANIDGMEENVYRSIKFSYDFLRSEEAQSLFLLCSMREEDANIHLYLLLIQVIGWGLFQNVYTLEETMWRLHALVNKLKARYLLLEGDHYWSVKMHDVVRDVGISIASKERCMYNIGSNLELEQYLKTKKLEGSTAISLQYDDVDALPEMLNCEQLQLLVMKKIRWRRIPDRLFEVTKNLRLADLSKSYLKPIPSSFESLQNLKSLILNGCTVGDVAIIGELKCLEALSFRKSNIKLLPEKIGQLICLRLLDLNGCSQLEVVHTNVISKLSRLEELNMLKTFIKWEAEGWNGDRKNARLTELKNLVQLSALHLHIPPTQNFPENLFNENLERFVILIEDQDCHWPDDQLKTDPIFCTRSLKLGVNSSHLVEELGLGTLLKRAEELHLDRLEGLNNVIPQLDMEGFPQLKHLVFQNNNGVKYIIDSMYQRFPHYSVFQCLESLRLRSMLKLEKICQGKIELESFGQLRVIEVFDCGELREFFSASVAKLLLQLENISVKNCKMMKDIVTDDGQGVHHERIFPKIKSLTFEYVQELQRFYGLNSSDGTIPAFFNGKLLASSSCFQHLTKLVIVGSGSLKYLFLSSAPLNLVQLNTLEIRDCFMMEEIIKTSQATDKVLFPLLTSLTLENLPKLTYIFNDNVTFPSLQRIEIEDMDKLEMIWQTPSTSDSFSKLEKIQVLSCKNLRKMFPSYMLRRFWNLRDVGIGGCEMLEEVFEMIQNSDAEEVVCDNVTAIPLTDLTIVKLPNLKHIWNRDPRGTITFENLRCIIIVNCQSLKNLFPISIAKGLHQLEELIAMKCGIQEIVANEEESETRVAELFVFPKLISVALEHLPELVSFYPRPYTSKWPLLESVEVIQCPKLNKVFSSVQANIPIQQYALFSLEKVVSFPSTESTCFQNLTKLSVENCGFLKYIFSSTADLHLLLLKDLSIKGCIRLKEVIRTTAKSTSNLALPKLNRLELNNLPKLTRFCTGTFVDLSSLTELKIKGCHQLKTFLANSKSTNMAMLSLFYEHVAISNLKKIEVSDTHYLKLIWHNEHIAPDSFFKLEDITVDSCANLVKLFPSNMLGRLSSLIRLEIRSCHLLEEVALLLEQSENDHQQGRSFKLKYYFLFGCQRLKRVESPSMSFENLRILTVVKCHEVVNLFSPRTARSLKKLRRILVAKCEKMREIIVADETDEAGEICFDRLERLVLDSLPNFTIFCSGNYSMRFPMLKNVMVNGCPEMRSFCGQKTRTPKLKRLLMPAIEEVNTSYILNRMYDETIYDTSDDEDTESEDEYRLDPYSFWVKLRGRDLNATIRQLWERQIEDMGVSLQKLFAEKHTEISDEDYKEDYEEDSEEDSAEEDSEEEYLEEDYDQEDYAEDLNEESGKINFL